MLSLVVKRDGEGARFILSSDFARVGECSCVAALPLFMCGGLASVAAHAACGGQAACRQCGGSCRLLAAMPLESRRFSPLASQLMTVDASKLCRLAIDRLSPPAECFITMPSRKYWWPDGCPLPLSCSSASWNRHWKCCSWLSEDTGAVVRLHTYLYLLCSYILSPPSYLSSHPMSHLSHLSHPSLFSLSVNCTPARHSSSVICPGLHCGTGHTV